MNKEDLMLSIMSRAGIYSYAINKDTYEIIFIDSKMQNAIKEAKIGDVCHEVFFKSDTPCKTCKVCDNDFEQVIYDPCDGGIWFKGIGYSVELDDCKNAAVIMNIPTTMNMRTIMASKDAVAIDIVHACIVGVDPSKFN